MGRRACVCIAFSAVVAGLCVPGAASAGSSSSGLVRAVNATRGEAGAAPVREDASLDAMALDHSADMAEAGRIFHNAQLGPDADARGVVWTMLGENVGSGATVEQVEGALVASPHHYANLVDRRFTRIGAAVIAGPDGRVYITQVFADDAPPPPPPPPRRVAPAVHVARAVTVVEARPRPAPPPDLMRTEDGHLVPEIFFSAPPLPDDGWLGATAAADPVAN